MGDGQERRPVTVNLGTLACRALGGEEGCGAEQVSARVKSAVRAYLHEKGSGRAGWSYPRFMRGRQPSETIAVELELETGLWRSLEEEAVDQGVEPKQLVEHAVMYYAAEIDAGHVTQRILDELGRE